MNQDENLIDEKSDLTDLHDFILSVFRKKFGDKVIRVNLTPVAHECWATVVVKEKSQEMEKMVR